MMLRIISLAFLMGKYSVSKRRIISLDPKLGASYTLPMRVIAKRTLREFWSIPEYSDSEQPLKAWHREAEKADWSDPHEIKDQYTNASILKNSRVVFNIAGNKYRLVVKINYQYKIVYVRFIGTHEQYNETDVENV